jgi:hypothetical protein
MMRRTHVIAAALLWLTTTAGGCHRAETMTPEAKAARGDTMLRQMSETLAGTQTFTYTAQQHRTRPGTSTAEVVTRHVSVRRPNGIAVVGDQNSAWYDGKSLTVVSAPHKAWARGPMPPTLDEAIDFLLAEYALQIPSADLLYSSPYDALMTADTKGGWVDVQNVGETACEHLAYTAPSADWELWLSQDARRLPRQLTITYKNEPGAPSMRVVFSNFNMSPRVGDDTFTATIPDGYERIRLMRHATVQDTGAATAEPAAASGDQPAAPRP